MNDQLINGCLASLEERDYGIKWTDEEPTEEEEEND